MTAVQIINAIALVLAGGVVGGTAYGAVFFHFLDRSANTLIRFQEVFKTEDPDFSYNVNLSGVMINSWPGVLAGMVIAYQFVR